MINSNSTMSWTIFIFIHFFCSAHLKELASPCRIDADCNTFVVHSKCFHQRCVCQMGFRSDGPFRCINEKSSVRLRRQLNYAVRMLGEDCQSAHQCRRFSGEINKICVANRCECSYGFIAIDAYRCIRDFESISTPVRVTKSLTDEPSGYGSACSTTNDCQQATNQLLCLNGRCLCAEGYVPLGRFLCYSVPGPSTMMIERSSMMSTFATRATTTTMQPINNEVIKSLGKLGNTCRNDYFCRRAVLQSHCYNGQCTCIDGFMPFDLYTCTKNVNDQTTSTLTLPPVDYKSLLGGPCSNKRNCHTSNAICLDSICTCPKGYFPVDDWSCLQEPESSDEESAEITSSILTTLTTTTITVPTTMTTIFRWWPWSPTPATRHPMINLANTFRVRCLLNRQCASMDRNSHCTLFGRCICNQGYQLETTNREQHCVRQIINEDDCD